MFLDDAHLRIRYDCPCQAEFTFKRRIDAEANFAKNDGKHICRKCRQAETWEKSASEIIHRTKWTNRQRYGVDSPMQTPEGLEAMKQGIAKNNPGAQFPLQTDKAAEKMNEAWWAKKGRPWKTY